MEREFRRWQGVSRCRPLGKDRFFCRYWWFDGVGGMELVSSAAGQGAGVVYGAGRLFVQGPSQDEWDYICGKTGLGHEGTYQKRLSEEGGEKAILGVEEWGFYEEEEEVSDSALRRGKVKLEADSVDDVVRQPPELAQRQGHKGARSQERSGQVARLHCRRLEEAPRSTLSPPLPS